MGVASAAVQLSQRTAEAGKCPEIRVSLEDRELFEAGEYTENRESD